MAVEFGTGLSGIAATIAARPRSVQRPQAIDERSQGNAQNEESPTPKVGFGEGTVSALGVAATTVDRNLEAARRIVPTLDELSQAARERAAETRDEADEAKEARLDATETAQRNERAARAQTRFFEDQDESTENEPAQRPDRTLEFLGANARTVVDVVVPEPVASFDVFG